jgi:serine protease AprX
MTDPSRSPRILLLLTALLLAMALPGPASAGTPPDLFSAGVRERLQGDSKRDVFWIFFKDKGFSDPAAEARAIRDLPDLDSSRRPARRHARDRRDLPVASGYIEKVREAGGTIRHTSRWLNGVSVEMAVRDVPRLGALTFVRRVELVRRSKRPLLPGADLDSGRLEGSSDPSPQVVPDPQGSPGPGLMTSYPAEEALHYGPSFNQNNQVGIVGLHRLGYTGAGVTLAVFDTGFRTSHLATLGRRVVAERDFVFNDDDVDNEPEDNVNAWFHGTAAWSNAGGFRPGALVGGAFEATILLAKTEDIRSETPIEEDNYVAALEWADSLGADVVTASLAYLDFDGTGDDYTYSELNGNTTVTAIAVDIAVSRGIAVTNAIGNSGPNAGTLNTPADADSVIAVGAVDSLGTVAGFSSRGPTSDGQVKPEVVARGVKNFVAFAATNNFGSANGTSFSTPVTAGAATLLIEAHPDWSGYQVRQAMMSTASHPGSPDNITGYGLLNALSAASQSAVSPPLVSLPFALIAPSRASIVLTALPQLRWERSLPGLPGDTIEYLVLLSTNPQMSLPDTFSVGPDTTWVPDFYLTPGTTYYWTVLAVNDGGWVRGAYMPMHFTVDPGAVSAVDPAGPSGARVRLLEARPNPFSPSTRIRFELPDPGEGTGGHAWSINVYSASGRLVRRLDRGTWGPGARIAEVAWDGLGDSGSSLSGGVYFVSLEALGRRSTMKVVLSR